jgi:hypothetical protein
MPTDKPRSIVTYVHRPKRLPRKKAQAAAITGPANPAIESRLLADGPHARRPVRGTAGERISLDGYI